MGKDIYRRIRSLRIKLEKAVDEKRARFKRG